MTKRFKRSILWHLLLMLFLFFVVFFASTKGEGLYNVAAVGEIITYGAYADFLNQVASTDPYHLYDRGMANEWMGGAILRHGTPGYYGYEIIGGPNLPVNFVSKLDLMHYCN